jgi:hypothetical protein
MWVRQHRRSLLSTSAFVLLGVAAVLVALAAVVWASGLGHREPPVVNIAPPAIHFAPNITVQPGTTGAFPPAPVNPTSTENEGSKVVTEYVIFRHVKVDDFDVATGWQYRDSKDAMPYEQWCYVNVRRTGRLAIGWNGKTSATLYEDARTLGIGSEQAARFVDNCQWQAEGLAAKPQKKDGWKGSLPDLD